MFGLKPKKKKYRASDSLRSALKDSIERKMYSEESVQESNPFENIPFLPDRQTNTSIPIDILNQLPPWLRRYAFQIDLDKYFREEPQEDDVTRISKSPVNVILLSKEKRLQVKAKELGREKPDGYTKDVGL